MKEIKLKEALILPVSQRGAILPLIVVALPAMLLALVLALDIGNMMSIKEQMQTAADAGALAAAMEVGRGSTTSVGTAQARQATADNGFTDGVDSVAVTVNLSSSGACDAGKTGDNFAEVMISKDYDFYFVDKIMSVSACAVAATPSKKICLMALGNSGTGINTQGSARVAVNSCGLHSNSTSSSGVRTQGSATISSGSTTVVGGYEGSGFTPIPQTGVDPILDPLAALPAPVPPYTNPYNTCTSTTPNKSGTISPGLYCGGISVGNNRTLTLQPGMYILLGGGLQVGSGATVSSTGGVTLYNTCLKLSGPGNTQNCPRNSGSTNVSSLPTGCTSQLCGNFVGFNFAGNATVTLSAPTSGTYKNILFFADRLATGFINSIGGTGSLYTDSLMYFPSQTVTVSGNGQLNGAIVANNMDISGNGTFTVNFSTAVSGSVDLAGSRAFLQ